MTTSEIATARTKVGTRYESRSDQTLSRVVLATTRLLDGHGDAESFLRGYEVVGVLGIVTEVDLNPPHSTRIAGVSRRSEVVGDRCGGVVAHVGGLVGGEQHRLSAFYPTFADGLTVDVESDCPSFADTTPVVVELGSDLMLAGIEGCVPIHLETLGTEQVVAIGRFAFVDI